MGAYEGFVGGLVLLVAVVLPALVALRAAYRQHSRWLILAYAAIMSAYGTYVQGRAFVSHDPQSLHIDDGFTFLVGLVLLSVLGGGVYLLARAVGASKHPAPSLREQAVYLAVFAGLLVLAQALSAALGFSPFA